MKNNTQKTVMLNSFQHPHLNLPLPKEEEILKPFDRTLNKNFSGRGHVVKAVVQDDNRMGFTLIELLVVVLIIGILAAVAVPQYQLAVNKSRAVQAITMLKSITDAQEVYFLANGEYTTDLTELDIEVPENMRGKNLGAIESEDPNQYLFICPDQKSCHAWASSNNLPNFEIVLPHTTVSYVADYRGAFWCVSQRKTNLAKNICANMGTPSYSNGYYRIN